MTNILYVKVCASWFSVDVSFYSKQSLKCHRNGHVIDMEEVHTFSKVYRRAGNINVLKKLSCNFSFQLVFWSLANLFLSLGKESLDIWVDWHFFNDWLQPVRKSRIYLFSADTNSKSFEIIQIYSDWLKISVLF